MDGFRCQNKNDSGMRHVANIDVTFLEVKLTISIGQIDVIGRNDYFFSYPKKDRTVFPG